MPAYAKNRSSVKQVCFRAPNGKVEHEVSPNPGGWFDVLSNRSGNTYRVNTMGECTCAGFERYSRCTHLTSVLEFAQDVLRTRKDS